jgi:hypothetical protein
MVSDGRMRMGARTKKIEIEQETVYASGDIYFPLLVIYLVITTSDCDQSAQVSSTEFPGLPLAQFLAMKSFHCK